MGAAGPGYSSGDAIQHMEQLAAQVLPNGITYEWTDLAHQQKEQTMSPLVIFAASALFVFLVLAAQYESWKTPLAIVLIVPMCLLAAAIGLNMRGMPIDILAQIGFVVLVGLAAKNAILIVEFARQRQDEDGVNAEDAATHAAHVRLRPDPDDVVRLYRGRGTARRCQRRRLGNAAIARHDGVLRHARRDALRARIHPGVLRLRSQARHQERACLAATR